MPEEVKRKPRGRPFEKGNQFAAKANRTPKQETEALSDVPELPAGLSEGERQTLLELWRWGKSGRQGSGSALRSFYELGFGKARQKPEVPAGPQVSDETMRRCVAIAEVIVAREAKAFLDIPEAEELLAFLQGIPGEERGRKGLSSATCRALEESLEAAKQRAATQAPKSNGEGFKAFQPPEPRKATTTEEPDAARAVLLRQPRTVVTNPDPLLDHAGEVPRL